MFRWYFRDGTIEDALRIWEDCCNYLYFPRVVNAEVFQRTVQDRLASEIDGNGRLGHSGDPGAIAGRADPGTGRQEPRRHASTVEGFDETPRRREGLITSPDACFHRTRWRPG